MMTEIIRRSRRLDTKVWVVACLLAAAFVLSQASNAPAQTNVTTTTGGTANKIPKWTGTTSVENSVMAELSNNIGIGTTTPAYKLDIFGTSASQLHLTSNGTADGLYLFANGSDAYQLGGASFEGSQWIAKSANAELFSQASGAFVFYSNTGMTVGSVFTPTERMRLNNGYLGIGTATPGRLLHIRDAASTVFTGARVSVPVDSSDPVYELLHETANKGFRWRLGNGGISDLYLDYTTNGFASHTPYLSVLNNGNVSIGNTSPATLLHLRSGTAGEVLRVDDGGNAGWIRFDSGGTAKGYVGFGDNNSLLSGAAPQSIAVRAENALHLGGNALMTMTLVGGNVGIGTTSPTFKLHVAGNAYVTGSLTVDGNLAAKYQDVAEWVPASRAIPAGTVVVLDAAQSNHVLPSNYPYDTRVAGVVSARPGVLLGERGEGKVMVATTGRVRVKVDATSAPIRVGDLLVTSDKEGIAMRSQPLDLGGTPIHRPGTLIGKALEPLDKGLGEILVLLSLQ